MMEQQLLDSSYLALNCTIFLCPLDVGNRWSMQRFQHRGERSSSCVTIYYLPCSTSLSATVSSMYTCILWALVKKRGTQFQMGSACVKSILTKCSRTLTDEDWVVFPLLLQWENFCFKEWTVCVVCICLTYIPTYIYILSAWDKKKNHCLWE